MGPMNKTSDLNRIINQCGLVLAIQCMHGNIQNHSFQESRCYEWGMSGRERQYSDLFIRMILTNTHREYDGCPLRVVQVQFAFARALSLSL